MVVMVIRVTGPGLPEHMLFPPESMDYLFIYCFRIRSEVLMFRIIIYCYASDGIHFHVKRLSQLEVFN